jgi:hypothetical protein
MTGTKIPIMSKENQILRTGCEASWKVFLVAFAFGNPRKDATVSVTKQLTISCLEYPLVYSEIYCGIAIQVSEQCGQDSKRHSHLWIAASAMHDPNDRLHRC